MAWGPAKEGFGTDRVRSYRVTLAENEKTADKEEKEERLTRCHQRCANRTLKVLERNGSIFIKLGQHLVRSASP